MKKLTLTIPAILLFSIAILAQADSAKPFEWKTLAPKTEEFSVDAPDSVQPSVFYNDDANNIRDKKENRRYGGMSGKTYFFIFSDVSAYDPQFKIALKFVEIYRKDELEKQKSAKAMKFEFSDDENFFHTIYAVKTKKRSYIFHSVSESENDPNVARFFNSLKINTASAFVKPVEKPNSDKESKDVIREPAKTSAESENPARKDLATGNKQERGRGAAITADEGHTGDGFGTSNGKTLQSGENTGDKPLNITFKPRPKYNDFARFYGITGSVRTRVAFRQDGTISSVSPVTRLPFGLTNSAITAAKEMRFEPQILNGRPVSVSKVIVFNFTIY